MNVSVTYLHDGLRHSDEEGHGSGEIVHQVLGQDGDEDVLPVHGIQQGFSSLK